MKGPLDGIRVLDASQMMAGPICGMRLGDLGAEVLKIEPPGVGEWTRAHGFAGAEIKGQTTALLGLNRNKKSVTVNLKNPAGRDTLYELARKSDVFIQNFRVGTAARLGVDYAQLQTVNPAIIYCSISGYGETGPHAGRPGQDLVLQGYSGSMWSVGKRSDPPLPGPLWAVDAMTGYQAAVGILAALHHRTQTGQGQKVAVNMLGVVMDCQCQELTTHLNLGILPERPDVPTAHAWINAPYGAYPTADGWIVLAMAPIAALGAAIDDDVLRAMTSWSDGSEHRDEIFKRVAARTPQKKTGQWLAIFEKAGVWAGPVYDYADLVNDPHVIATDMITSVQHPTIGELRMPNVPIHFSATPACVRSAPPLLGQHTEEVLEDVLGMSAGELERLRSEGAI